MRNTFITINQQHCQHNLATLKQRTKAHLLAMVKADAYGHGIAPVVASLGGADGFGVACMAEAIQVKACLPKDDPRPIVLIEGVFDFTEWQQVTDMGLMAFIHHRPQLDYALAHIPKKNSNSATVWLKLNTGMNRLGFDPQSAIVAAEQLIDKGYQLVLTSHFACADTPKHPLNQSQITCFNNVFTALQRRFGDKVQASLCNSAGLLTFKEAHYDWVRTGIALYGGSPLSTVTAKELNLSPVMGFYASVIAIHHLKKGETVGYGALWTADKDTTVAIISAGYGDGYPRVVTDAKVAIAGTLYAVVGRVAMDMMAIELGTTSVCIGDKVELWGDIISIDQVAGFAGTIGYELLCRVTARPTRLYPPNQKNQTQALVNNS